MKNLLILTHSSNLNFKDWLREQATAVAASASASAPAPVSSSTTSSSSGGTLSSDIAKVPNKIGCGKDCGRDYKNWYYSKRKKKKK